MRRDVDEAIVELAATQYSAFSRSQVLERGGDDALIRRRRHSGRWLLEAPGVYGIPGVPDSYERRLWVGHLAVGPQSIVSHEAGAALHTFTGFPCGPVVLTVPHSGYQRLPGITVHQITDLTLDSCIEIAGLPVSNVPRTLVDLAAVCRVGRLAAALDDAVITQRLTTYSAVGRELTAVARRGKPHLGILVALLDKRGPGKVPPQSVLERRLFELIQTHGLPEPIRQYPHPGRLFTDGCVDAAYLEAKLIVEADGRRWHTRMKDMARDALRDAEASRAGWATLRLPYESITDEPDWTAELIADTIATRAAQLGLTA